MKRKTQLLVPVVSLFAVAFGPLRAQVPPDGTIITLSNVTNVIAGDVTVGTNGAFTLLTLADNALLTNSAHGVIGRNATATSNQVHLVSPSARWLMGGSLFVGSNGAFSTLVVSNGALARSSTARVGALPASGSNVVLVTGSGSTWSNVGFGSSLNVGLSGSGNQLLVRDGGRMLNLNGSATIGSNGSNNLARVTGTGSVWSNFASLNIGVSGGGNVNNRLLVEEGGQVFAFDAFVGGVSGSSNNLAVVSGSGSLWRSQNLTVGNGAGHNALVVSNGGVVLSATASAGSSSSSAFNQALVTGAGSLWSNQADMFIGFAGSGNHLRVSNGATVAASNLFIGFNAASLDNRVTVDGGTLRVTNVAGNGTMDVRRGTNVLNAGLMEADRLFLTNGAGHLLFNGGTLITRGAVIRHPVDFVVGNPGAGPAIWHMRPGAGNHFIEDDLLIGNQSPFNQLHVTDGALLESDEGAVMIGGNSGAHSNTVFVSGPDSRLLTESAPLYVGFASLFNRLIITNGGLVSPNGCIVGGEQNATNNEATITGPGSTLNLLLQGLQIGASGSSNRVLIEEGGLLSGDFQVGRTVNSVGNVLSVTGPGSRVETRSNGGDQNVGFDGSASVLMVSNGAVVQGFEGVIGRSPSSVQNLAVITGTGSLWTNTGEMYVGYEGSGNRLVVSDGGTVFAQFTRFLGHNDLSTSNTVFVTGAGSAWLGPGDIQVAGPGAFSQVIVSDGARVESASSYIGSSSGGSNFAMVMDPGSVWSNTANFYVGRSGPGNQLVVSNGGFVANGLDAILGVNPGGNFNAATLTGAGSRWAANRYIVVGHAGTFNRLKIDDGASMTSREAAIGFLTGSQHNEALVSGVGTTWTNLSDFAVGFQGSSNRFSVTNGALVVSHSGVIGAHEPATANAAEISGSGSRWLISSNLQVGSNGNFNALIVRDGGLVVNSNAFLGSEALSFGNTALIGGAGTIWSNRQTLFVGQFGSGNQVIVSEEAGLQSRFASIGANATSSNNTVVVTGPGSFWQIEQSFIVGNFGSGNRLVVSNGARLLGRGTIGSATGSNNEVVVTGSKSSWTNDSLTVGGAGSGNRLVIRDGGEVVARTFGVVLGSAASSINNRIVVDGGALRVLDSELDVRRGTNVLNAGWIDASRLLMTNAQGRFEFNGGTLITRSAVISNGGPFVVGRSGAIPAVWDVRAGAGDHVVRPYVVVGAETAFNRLLVTNGALLTTSEGVIGESSGGHSNQVIVSGPGSRLEVPDDFNIGGLGSFNALVISNGASVNMVSPAIGLDSGSSNNQVVVTGSNSLWTIPDSMRLGHGGAANRALFTDGGTVVVSNELAIGLLPLTSSNNLLQVAGGVLFVTNGSATGTLNIRSGTNRLDAGLIDVDRFVITDARGEFAFNGGRLRTAGTTLGHGRSFGVGNGADRATLELCGGSHIFLGGLVVANEASLTGHGSIAGTLTVRLGGTLAPGGSIGTLALNSPPVLQGATLMEIGKTGSTLTNDQIRVTSGSFTYGGSLMVTNAGPDAPAAGDRFQLFDASSLAGSFATLSLPPLPAGLTWLNKLLVDGSIEVVVGTPPRFVSVSLSGTNLVLSGTGGVPNSPYAVLSATNVALPLSSWVSVATNQFDGTGGFTFTHGIRLDEPARFFRLEAQ